MSDGSDNDAGRFARQLAIQDPELGLPMKLCLAATELAAADGGSLTLHRDAGSPVLVAATNSAAARLHDAQDIVGDGPSMEAARQGSVVAITLEDFDHDQWQFLYEHLGRDHVFGRILAIPVTHQGHFIGVLTISNPVGDLHTLVALAHFLSSALGRELIDRPVGADDSDLLDAEYGSHVDALSRASGIVAEQSGRTIPESLSLIKSYAFVNGENLTTTSVRIADQSVRFNDLSSNDD